MLRFRSALLILLTLALLSGWVGNIPPAHAAEATFTLTIKSAFLRTAPSWSAPRVYSIFKDQTYAVLAYTADYAWFRLDYAGVEGAEAWVWSGYGTFAGDLGLVSMVPVLPVANTAPVSAAPATTSSNPVYYTLNIKSAFARAAPSWSAPRAASLFKGDTYPIVSKTADGQWLRLDMAGVAEAWVLTVNGKIKGDLNTVPVNGAAAVSASTSTSASSAPAPASGNSATPPGVLPALSARAREIYQAGLAQGNRPRAFSKVGDCMSVNPYFLTPFDNAAEYRLGADYAYLQDTIANFTGSFSRESQAARIGFSTLSLLDPIWANPKYCTKSESPLECEFRLNRPSIAFISLGTNGEWLTDTDYEASLRRILDFSIGRGVLPILTTKADDVESGGRFNAIIIKLAGEYDLPLWNFRALADTLPNRGIRASSSYQLTWGQALYDGPASTWTGWQWRNLTALQALDAVWKAAR